MRSWIGNAAAVISLLLAVTSLIGFTIGYDAGRIALTKYLHLFVLGLAIAWIVDHAPASAETFARVALPPSVLAYITVFLFFDQIDSPYYIYQSPLAAIVCAALLLSCLLAGQSIINRLLGLPVAIWLGEISFSVYLLHRHAEWVVNNALGWNASVWITFPLKIVLTLMMAQLAYNLIEIPARQSLRKLGAERRAETQGT